MLDAKFGHDPSAKMIISDLTQDVQVLHNFLKP